MEVEKRRIHLDMGYSSLFVFLTKHLKYSDGSAYRRIEAMKIMRDVPDLGQRITVGAISVTVAAEISRIVKIKKIKDVDLLLLKFPIFLLLYRAWEILLCGEKV